MKKSQRVRINKLARRAKAQRLNDSAPRKVKRLRLEVAKLTVTKIELNRICIQPRGNEAIRAKYDHGPVLAIKAEAFNRGLDKY